MPADGICDYPVFKLASKFHVCLNKTYLVYITLLPHTVSLLSPVGAVFKFSG
jgi:hypothetical protein